jgi:hypothetical protein
MADQIRYDLLTQQALRAVVRSVLADTAKHGVLPGDHHFYITFDTTAEGVRMPERLRAQYPEQITIILQHQFWDLKVDEDAFEVGLSFGGVPSKLTVPFEAVSKFIDPSAQFSLQFEEVTEADGEQAAPANVSEKPPEKAADKPSDKPAEPKKRLPASPVAVAPTPDDDKPTQPTGGAEVVRLDRFRKK